MVKSNAKRIKINATLTNQRTKISIPQAIIGFNFSKIKVVQMVYKNNPAISRLNMAITGFDDGFEVSDTPDERGQYAISFMMPSSFVGDYNYVNAFGTWDIELEYPTRIDNFYIELYNFNVPHTPPFPVDIQFELFMEY
jgi:hypothetical protein